MMQNKIQISFSISRATLSLALLTMLCCILLTIRVVETQQLQGIFLLWNLFLAWVPLFFALIARRLASTTTEITKSKQILIYTTLALWLLFFPNSPYIITDLMHLGEYNNQILWFDTKSFWTAKPCLIAWVIVSISIVLSGFGLYLGRFVRFNSWDLFTNPFYLFRQSLNELRNPLAMQTTMVFTLVVMVLYISMIILIPNRHESVKNVA